jgi:hypothetical protein
MIGCLLCFIRLQIKTVIIAGVYFRAVGAPIFIMYHTFGAFLLVKFFPLVLLLFCSFVRHTIDAAHLCSFFTLHS